MKAAARSHWPVKIEQTRAPPPPAPFLPFCYFMLIETNSLYSSPFKVQCSQICTAITTIGFRTFLKS